jgi:hypothetical protein
VKSETKYNLIQKTKEDKNLKKVTEQRRNVQDQEDQ